jgi:hypothetical protein
MNFINCSRKNHNGNFLLLWLHLCYLHTVATSQFIPPAHRMHTIQFDSSYVTAKVGNIAVAGTSREGRAMKLALETNVRTALSPNAGINDSVGLNIMIDRNSLNGVEMHTRIAMRPLKYFTGGNCETACLNNETCPQVTYLRIEGTVLNNQ